MAYWRKRGALAWESSRGLFDWRHAVGIGVLGLAVRLYRDGWVAALMELVETTLYVAMPVVLWGAGVYLWNFFLAGKRLYNTSLREHETCAQEWQTKIQGLENRIASLQAQNRGISLKCEQIDFLMGKDDLTIMASVKNVVNGNIDPVAIQVSLCVPFRLGGMQVIASTLPSMQPIPDIKTSAPLLPPIMNLSGKQAVGPGIWLFPFTHKYLTGFPFPYGKDSMEQLSQRVRDTEMYFEVLDLTNDVQPKRFDAPGTLTKRIKRLGRVPAEGSIE